MGSGFDQETVTFIYYARFIIRSDVDVTIDEYKADYLDLMKYFYDTNKILQNDDKIVVMFFGCEEM